MLLQVLDGQGGASSSSARQRAFGGMVEELCGRQDDYLSLEHRILHQPEPALLPGRGGSVSGWRDGLGQGIFAPPGRQRFSNAAGIGLHIENTKVQGAGLIRIDWAINLDEQKPGQIIISSKLPFSAFLNLDGVSGLGSLEGE